MKVLELDKNFIVVEGLGLEFDNLVIMWKFLNGFEFNGLGFQYKVSWCQKDGDDEWIFVVVVNVFKYIVLGMLIFVLYLIKVQVLNDMGFVFELVVVMGYFGEDFLMVVFGNVCVNVVNSILVEVYWDLVFLKSI